MNEENNNLETIRKQAVKDDNLSTTRDSVVNIIEQSNRQVWQEKLHEMQQGEQELKDKYGAVYKEDVLNEMVNEYKQNKQAEILQDLKEFDDKIKRMSQSNLESLESAEIRIEESVEPITDKQFKEHDYYTRKIEREFNYIFSDGNVTADKLKKFFKRGHLNDSYGKALYEVKDIPLGKIEQSDLEPMEKIKVKSEVEDMFDNLLDKVSIMNNGYKIIPFMREEMQNINRTASQTSMFKHYI
ncbi:putative uncharacterized protein [Staphylococcus equorum subsp. equorum Mu2]|uniref:hypothetical protein n=1 Tax=Staphylococcus equorum TaxID=246432 RepID=UPI000267DEA2|nr:hypothetical protein [Staphylococcus equorum]CCI60783.1 putative uncharacterized protein [Staphylococcus equorum subsp. equorum Mu2]